MSVTKVKKKSSKELRRKLVKGEIISDSTIRNGDIVEDERGILYEVTSDPHNKRVSLNPNDVWQDEEGQMVHYDWKTAIDVISKADGKPYWVEPKNYKKVAKKDYEKKLKAMQQKIAKEQADRIAKKEEQDLYWKKRAEEHAIKTEAEKQEALEKLKPFRPLIAEVIESYKNDKKVEQAFDYYTDSNNQYAVTYEAKDGKRYAIVFSGLYLTGRKTEEPEILFDEVFIEEEVNYENDEFKEIFRNKNAETIKAFNPIFDIFYKDIDDKLGEKLYDQARHYAKGGDVKMLGGGNTSNARNIAIKDVDGWDDKEVADYLGIKESEVNQSKRVDAIDKRTDYYVSIGNPEEFANGGQINFHDVVKDKDVQWAEAGMTGDAQDMYDELVEKHGEEHKEAIKDAIEKFYEIKLDELAKGGKVKDAHKVKELYDRAEALFNGYVGNGGKLDYSDKEYGYLIDDLDYVDIGYYEQEPDGDHQQELADENYKMSEKEVIETLEHRIENIEYELNNFGKGGRAGRPSPSVSATLFKVGDQKIGNDGNWWEIREDVRGTKSWKKIQSWQVKQAKPVAKQIPAPAPIVAPIVLPKAELTDLQKELLSKGFINDDLTLTNKGKRVVDLHKFCFPLEAHPFSYVYQTFAYFYPNRKIEYVAIDKVPMYTGTLDLYEIGSHLPDTLKDLSVHNSILEQQIQLSKSNRVEFKPYSYCPGIGETENGTGFFVFANYVNNNELYIDSTIYNYVNKHYTITRWEADATKAPLLYGYNGKSLQVVIQVKKKVVGLANVFGLYDSQKTMDAIMTKNPTIVTKGENISDFQSKSQPKAEPVIEIFKIIPPEKQEMTEEVKQAIEGLELMLELADTEEERILYQQEIAKLKA